jgi:hypothetical protein
VAIVFSALCNSNAVGHSESRVTMDFYAHLQKQTAAKAARHMDGVLSR